MEITDTILCSNCTRQIPAGNFSLHENHCKRNITKCLKCQQPVAAQDKDSHEKLHEQMTCECGQVMEQQQVSEHLANSCINRDIICTYCELPIKYCDLASHQNYCGSRTDICTLCKQYVTLKNMEMHLSTNCEYPPKRVVSTRSAADRLDLLRQEVLVATQLSSTTNGLVCNRCNQPCEDMEALQTHLSTQCHLSPHLQLDNEDKIPCEYCNQLVTVSSYMEHSATCGLGSELEMLDDFDYRRGGALRRQKKMERKLQTQMAQKQSLKSIDTSKRSMRYQPPPMPIKQSPSNSKSSLPKNPSRKASTLSTKPSKVESTKDEAEPITNDNNTPANADSTVDVVTPDSSSTALTDNNGTPAKVTKAPVRLKATKPAVKTIKSTKAPSKQIKPAPPATVIDLTSADSVFVALPDTSGITVQGTSVRKQTNRPKKQPTKRPTARTAA